MQFTYLTHHTVHLLLRRYINPACSSLTSLITQCTYFFSTTFTPHAVQLPSYLYDRRTVRSVAGTPQVPCQEWCRYPAGAPSGVLQKLAYWVSISQSTSLGDFLLAPACPIDKITLWEGLLYLLSGTKLTRGVERCERLDTDRKSDRGTAIH